jgi:hypothetical protein
MNKAARRAGALIQGAVLGLALTHSILTLTLIASGIRLFRYQGF